MTGADLLLLGNVVIALLPVGVTEAVVLGITVERFKPGIGLAGGAVK